MTGFSTALEPFLGDLFGQGGIDIAGDETDENLIGGGGDDRVASAGGDDLVLALTGDDSGLAGDGADTVFAGDGDNTVEGGEDDDVIAGQAGDDVLIGGRGDDVVSGGAGYDLMIWNNGDGSDIFLGGWGVDPARVTFDPGGSEDGSGNRDVARIATLGNRVLFDRIELDGQAVRGLFGIDIRQTEILELDAGNGDDAVEIVGTSMAAILPDLDGGADTADSRSAGGLDSLAEGDTADFSGSGFRVKVDLDAAHGAGEGLGEAGAVLVGGRSAVKALTDFENVVGSAGGDRIEGNAQANVLSGFHGADRILGRDGDDFIDGGTGHDLIRGGAGADRIEGGVGFDRFAFADGEGGDVILDFDILRESLGVDTESFGVDTLSVQTVARAGGAIDDTSAALLGVEAGHTVYALQGIFERNAGGAADALAEALQAADPDDEVDEGAGFFMYFNTNINQMRLFFAEDLDTVDGGIRQLANLGDPVAAVDGVNRLDQFGEANFAVADLDALFG